MISEEIGVAVVGAAHRRVRMPYILAEALEERRGKERRERGAVKLRLSASYVEGECGGNRVILSDFLRWEVQLNGQLN